jgi:hypothetical protein
MTDSERCAVDWSKLQIFRQNFQPRTNYLISATTNTVCWLVSELIIMLTSNRNLDRTGLPDLLQLNFEQLVISFNVFVIVKELTCRKLTKVFLDDFFVSAAATACQLKSTNMSRLNEKSQIKKSYLPARGWLTVEQERWL